MPAETTTEPSLDAQLVYLTRALKAPAMREAIPRLAERARNDGWTHEQFLVAYLEREVTAREARAANSGSRPRSSPPASH